MRKLEKLTVVIAPIELSVSCGFLQSMVLLFMVNRASVGGVSSANYQRCLESAVWSPAVSDQYICILPDCNSDISPFRSTLKM